MLFRSPVIGVHRTWLSTNIREGVIWSNTQNYRNAKVDALLAAAGKEPVAAKRKAAYQEVQRIVVDECTKEIVGHGRIHSGLGVRSEPQAHYSVADNGPCNCDRHFRAEERQCGVGIGCRHRQRRSRGRSGRSIGADEPKGARTKRTELQGVEQFV